MLVESIQELRKQTKGKGSVGFVPTMGYLHQGHLSLIKAAKKDNDLVVVSVFVNPTQFAPNEDFESYPRDIDRDYKLAVEAGADYVFHPSVDEMYVPGASTYVNVEGPITGQLCGASRPTHFKGVTSVVNTLFNIVKPDRAYFGQKDAQQAIIIKKMVRDLHMDVEVVVCPIIREEDGLAMSSRNVYLNEDERSQAVILNQALTEAEGVVAKGEISVAKVVEGIVAKINTVPLAEIDYVSVLSNFDLSDIEQIEDEALAAVAVRFGKTRLIDNRVLKLK